MTIRSLTTHEIVGAHAASIARSCARLAAGRIRRTPSLVAAEYDRGLWSRVYRERAWERAASLEAFLVGDGQKPLTAWVDNRPCRISQRDYYRYRLTALAALVESSLGGTEDLVELGSGYGYNLFALSLAFPNRRFIGLDISPAGVATGRAIAAHFGLQDRIEFDVIDLARSPSRELRESEWAGRAHILLPGAAPSRNRQHPSQHIPCRTQPRHARRAGRRASLALAPCQLGQSLVCLVEALSGEPSRPFAADAR